MLRSTVRCSTRSCGNGSEGPPGNKRELRQTTVLADAVNCRTMHNAAPLLAANPETEVARTLTVEDNLLLALGPELVHLDLVVLRRAVLELFRRWDNDGRVNVLKQWDIHRSVCLLNHRHLSLHHHRKVRSVLFKILLGCGKGLPLVERHLGYLWLLG